MNDYYYSLITISSCLLSSKSIVTMTMECFSVMCLIEMMINNKKPFKPKLNNIKFNMITKSKKHR